MIAFTRNILVQAVEELYEKELPDALIQIGETRKEFEGEVTIICFPLGKLSGKNPVATANELGEYFLQHSNEFDKYNVVKGFLNLSFSSQFWQQKLVDIQNEVNYGRAQKTGNKHLVEFCSPNTNKPLHLGHVRNILLGDAVSRIRSFAGDDIVRVQIINDRGVAICKSMLAWKLFANGATPESENIKPDHFVGDYYVLFEKEFQKEYLTWQETKRAQDWYKNEKRKEESTRQFFKRNKNN
mgnify:CR=1 FL=1